MIEISNDDRNKPLQQSTNRDHTNPTLIERQYAVETSLEVKYATATKLSLRQTIEIFFEI